MVKILERLQHSRLAAVAAAVATMCRLPAVAQARVLAGKRASLIRQREALLRREAALLAQVASIESQKQQLLV